MHTPSSSGRPFTRTRTGCLTCRGDGYKCDEQRPSCGRCVRLGKNCKGYGLQLRWQSPTRPQQAGRDPKVPRRRKSPSAALTRLRPQSPPASVLPPAMSSVFPLQQEYLLDHWRTTLALLITVSPTARNLFHSYITPMITHSPSLRSSICFMAAHHIMELNNDRSLMETATQHQTNAASSLRETVQTGSPLASLASIMILQITDRLFLTTSGANHLWGAKGIIDQAEPRTWDCGAGRFLLSVCSYYDAVGPDPPILAFNGDVPPLEDMKPLFELKVLWGIIGRISRMHSLDRSLFDSAGATIESILQTIDTQPSREGNEGHTIHAYKEAAYIYLHQVWHNVGSPHPETLQHAKDCLDHLFRVPVFSPLVSVHPWPLRMAASEIVDDKLRDSVRERVRAMYEERHLPSLTRLLQDIEDAWKTKDAEQASGDIDKVNWDQTILAIRQRDIGLA